jgi:hypothetical protein
LSSPSFITIVYASKRNPRHFVHIYTKFQLTLYNHYTKNGG